MLLLTLGLLAGCAGAFSDPEVKGAVERVSSNMEKQARASQTTRAIGETIELPNGERYTVERVASELAVVSAAPGERLIVVHVTITTATDAPLDFDPEQDFAITSEIGRGFRPIVVSEALRGQAAAGQTVSGTAAFSVPTDQTNLRFYWRRAPMTAVPLP